MHLTTAEDGVDVIGEIDGSDRRGGTIVVLHAGLDDGREWAKPAQRLAQWYRVIRPHRRSYRPELVSRGRFSIAQEALDVVALMDEQAEPVVLVGHSSGGVIALEAVLQAPERVRGLVLYEPPISVGTPLGGSAVDRARSAMDAGKPGKAMSIFLREVVETPGWVAALVRLMAPVVPQVKRFAAGQVDELEAIRDLGDRLSEYRAIRVPVLLIGGDKSPAHLAARMSALEEVLPDVRRVVLRRVGHDANRRTPDDLAGAIRQFVESIP